MRIIVAIVLIVLAGCGGAGVLGAGSWRLAEVMCGAGDYSPSGADFTVRFESERIVTTGESPACFVEYESGYSISEGRLETNSVNATKTRSEPTGCVLEYSLGAVDLVSESQFLRTIPDAGALEVSADGSTLTLQSGVGVGEDEGEPCTWTYRRQ